MTGGKTSTFDRRVTETWHNLFSSFSDFVVFRSLWLLISFSIHSGCLSSRSSHSCCLPRLRSRPKLVYDQTQSSAHPCVPRPKLKGLEGSSSALQSGPWSGDGLIRGRFGLKSLIIGGFERTWVWSEANSSAIGPDHNLFVRTWVWKFEYSCGSDWDLYLLFNI